MISVDAGIGCVVEVLFVIARVDIPLVPLPIRAAPAVRDCCPVPPLETGSVSKAGSAPTSAAAVGIMSVVAI